jgi:hypothetical protein
MTNEKDKMLRGELYLGNDPELIALRRVARVHVKQLNDSEAHTPEATAIMKQLFGSLGQDVVIEPPFRCDYGTNKRTPASSSSRTSNQTPSKLMTNAGVITHALCPTDSLCTNEQSVL